MNIMLMLVKREFWEHRSLYIAPLVWVGVITLMFAWVIFAVVPDHLGTHGMVMGDDGAGAMTHIDPSDRREIEQAIAQAQEHTGKHDGEKETFFAFSYLAITGLVTALACVVVFFYLIDCLYAERRDRSILFWKSLPVSDTQVVLSKFAVALVVVPLGATLLAAAMQLVLGIMFWARFHGTVLGAALPDWSFLAWFKSQIVALGLGLGGALWYAPIAGYLLLVSSWARRNVFLWAVLPPAALMALEGFFFHSANVAHFIGWRFGGYVKQLHVDPSALNLGTRSSAKDVPHVTDVLSQLDMSGMFLNAEVWIGLVAAAAMAYAAIRLRRYRDES